MATRKPAARKAAKKVTVKKIKPAKRLSKKSSAKKGAAKPKAKAPVKKSSLKKIQGKITEPSFIPEDSVVTEIESRPGSTRGMPEVLPATDCKCMKRKTKFYCYRLVQGGWQQVSLIGYPTKESCEADNCLA